MSRRVVIDVIAGEPSLSHFETVVADIAAPVAALETGWGESEDGEDQGDPSSVDLFSNGLEPDCKEGC